MNRSNLVRIHALSGTVALLLIGCFFISSLVAELSGITEWVFIVKKTIFFCVWAIPILLPLAASTGFKLAGSSQHPLVLRKKARLRRIVLNGLVLLGLACWLYSLSSQHAMSDTFFIVQLAETGLGAINIFLLGSMIRDGLQLSSRKKKALATP
jgi:hypothetical protein